jgi:hypothetical protein
MKTQATSVKAPALEQVQAQEPAVRVTQSELLEYVGIKNQIARLEADLKSRETSIKDLLAANAPIEDGPLTAKLDFRERKTVAWREEFEKLGDRLKGAGKGKIMADELLDKAEPSKWVQLTVK